MHLSAHNGRKKPFLFQRDLTEKRRPEGAHSHRLGSPCRAGWHWGSKTPKPKHRRKSNTPKPHLNHWDGNLEQFEAGKKCKKSRKEHKTCPEELTNLKDGPEPERTEQSLEQKTLENGVSASIRVISEGLPGSTDEGSQPRGRRSIEAVVGDAETLRPWGAMCRPHQDHPHRPQKLSPLCPLRLQPRPNS